MYSNYGLFFLLAGYKYGFSTISQKQYVLKCIFRIVSLYLSNKIKLITRFRKPKVDISFKTTEILKECHWLMLSLHGLKSQVSYITMNICFNSQTLKAGQWLKKGEGDFNCYHLLWWPSKAKWLSYHRIDFLLSTERQSRPSIKGIGHYWYSK